MISAVLLLLGLGGFAGVHAQQATNASIALLSEFSGLPFSGEIEGTGTDGTTYVLSASGTEPGDIPFTMTVVQDASRVSGELSLATGLGANFQCTYDSQGVGACIVVAEGAGTLTDAPPQTTIVSSTTIPFIAVPVTTASSPSSSSEESANGAATSSPSADASDDSSGATRAIMKFGLLSAFPILLAGLANA